MKDPKRGRDAERIRAALTRVTPSDPGVSARAMKVMARARRQRARRGTAGVLAVAASAAVLVIAPQILTSMRTENVGTNASVGEPTDTGEAAVDPFATTSCPAAPSDLGDPPSDQQTTDEIRGDARSIRLCLATVDGGVDEPWLPPRDAVELTVDDAFLTSAQQLPQADPDRCAAIRVAPDPYTFVVGYTDGTVETVAVSNVCTDLTVEGRRVASGDVLGTFQDSLAHQRQRLEPEQQGSLGISCLVNVPDTGPRVPLTRAARPDAETRFAAFLHCGSGDPEVAEPSAVGLLNDEWATSIRDLTTQAPLSVNRCPRTDVDSASSYGVTTWGDVLEFSFRRCGNYFVGGYGASPPEGDAMPGRPAVQFLPSERLAEALHLR